jgi:hypothetical protein
LLKPTLIRISTRCSVRKGMRFWPVTPTRNQLHLQGVGNVLGDVDVIALQAHVGAGRGEGREVGKDADIEGSGLGDVVDGIGARGCVMPIGTTQQQGGGKG